MPGERITLKRVNARHNIKAIGEDFVLSVVFTNDTFISQNFNDEQTPMQVANCLESLAKQIRDKHAKQPNWYHQDKHENKRLKQAAAFVEESPLAAIASGKSPARANVKIMNKFRSKDS